MRGSYGEKMKNGFISTIIAISFAAILLMLWMSLQQAAIKFERNLTEPQPLMYAGYYFDDVFTEVRYIVGPAVLYLYESNETFMITIADSMPKADFNSSLADYKAYLETIFASRVHAEISFNITNITDGSYELMVDRLQYRLNYSNSSRNSILFGTVDGANAGIKIYNINISVAKTRLNRVPFANDPGGDMNITFIYTDNSGTETETRTLDSSLLSASSITYLDNSSISINLGSASSPGQLEITDYGASPAFVFTVSFSLNSTVRLSPAYGSLLNYTQGRTARIGLLRR